MHQRLRCAQALRWVDSQQRAQEVQEQLVACLHDLRQRRHAQRAGEDPIAVAIDSEKRIFAELVDQVVAFFQQIRWDRTCIVQPRNMQPQRDS